MSKLSSLGYRLKKEGLEPTVIDEVKKDLTVSPKVNPKFNYGPVKSFTLYRESEQYIYVPRYYGLERFGIPKFISFPKDLIVERLSSNKIGLRDQQIPIVEKTLETLYNPAEGSGILHLYTGAGKTVIALHIITVLKVKTLIIVHKTVLLNQWVERINEFIPEAKIGILQGDRCEIENSDIVIAMLQTLSMKNYEPDTFKSIQFMIVDEAHHIAAETFSQALPKIGAKYNLGLSATPNRKDGLSCVFKHYLGEVIWKAQREAPSTLVKQILFESDSLEYCATPTNWKGNIMLPQMINNVANYTPRNLLIVHEIVEYLQEEPRQIIIMSERLAQLDTLYKLFLERKTTIERSGIKRFATAGLYIGKMKQSELELSSTKDVIFASASICREGLDISSLNTLVLATPSGDVVQAVGRIMRKVHQVPPLIIDIADCFSIFEGQTKKRLAFYKKSRFTLHTEHYKEGESLNNIDISSDEMMNDDNKVKSGSQFVDDV